METPGQFLRRSMVEVLEEESTPEQPQKFMTLVQKGLDYIDTLERTLYEYWRADQEADTE